MSENDPAMMMPEVMSKVAALGPSALKAVHHFIQQIELAALVEDIKDEAELLRRAGLEPELLNLPTPS